MAYYNNSTEEMDSTQKTPVVSFLENQPSHAIPYITMTVLALTVGICGNFITIGCFWISKKLRKVGNEFLFNMALSDLCVTGLAEPMCILGAIKGKEYFDNHPILCEMTASLCLTACICAFLNMGAITLNRYIRICQSKVYGKIYTRTTCIGMCIMIWIVAFIAEAPNFIWGNHFFDAKNHQCIWERTATIGYTFFLGVLLIAAPLIMMIIGYVAIFRRVKESKTKISISSQMEKKKEISYKLGLKDAIKSCKTLILVVVMMIICWTPYTVVILIDFNDMLSMEVHLLVTYLAHLHSSLTIFIYGLTYPLFRATCKRLLLCKCNDRNIRLLAEIEGKSKQKGPFSPNISVISAKSGTSSSDKMRSVTTGVTPLPEVEGTQRNMLLLSPSLK